MAESTRQKSKRRRSAGRERRRSMVAEPFERLDDEAGEESSGLPPVGETLKYATVTAAVAAGVGALAGAAKALLDRRDGDMRQKEDEDDDRPEGSAESVSSDEEDDEPEARAEPAEQHDDEGEDDEPEARAEPAERDDDEDEGGDDEPEARAEPAEQEEDDEEEEDDDEPEARVETDEEQPQPEANTEDEGDEDENADLQHAAKAGTDAFDVVPKARKQLEQLLGREAESVSGIQRTDGHWSVTLEVVELHRVPDTMDVLGSYELVLDDDGRVARLARRRRYARSEVEARS